MRKSKSIVQEDLLDLAGSSAIDCASREGPALSRLLLRDMCAYMPIANFIVMRWFCAYCTRNLSFLVPSILMEGFRRTI